MPIASTIGPAGVCDLELLKVLQIDLIKPVSSPQAKTCKIWTPNKFCNGWDANWCPTFL